MVDVDLLRGFAEEHDLGLVVLFGSQAKGRARPGSDTDLALGANGPSPDRKTRGRTEGELVAALGRPDLDLVWLSDASWLLAWEVAQGQPLYERQPGRFAEFRLGAWLRFADSTIWRRRDQEYLWRSREGWMLNQDLLRRKLNSMTLYLRDLEPLLEEPERFLAQPEVHYAAERLAQLLVDAAVAINTEAAAALAGIPPSDYYSSFFSLARAGWIDSSIATELGTVARLRNRLVHDYESVELPELYAELRGSLETWRRYLNSVGAKIEAPEAH